MADTQLKCANCDRLIGRLETPFVWQNNTVCAGCYEALNVQTYESMPRQKAIDEPIAHTNAAPTTRGEERELFQTTLHPFRVFGAAFLAAIMLLILGAILVSSSADANPAPMLLVFPMIAVVFLWAIVHYRSNRFVVSNRRISIRRGWLSRRSFELLLGKVESIQVEQSPFDRMLDSGTIIIRGTGGSRESFPGIRDAADFRRIATQAIEANTPRQK